MKKWNILKDERLRENVLMYLLAVVIVVVALWGRTHDEKPMHMDVDDGIEQVDLDTIYLNNSRVEVNFSEVLLSNHKETRELIVSEQTATVSTELSASLIKQLNFDFLTKTQTVSYRGTGYFIVDLGKLTTENVIQDKEKKTVTIKIDHAKLKAIEIDPNEIEIDKVEQKLLNRGDIKLTMKDYNEIEKGLRSRLENKFDTVANGQKANAIALKMVKEIYEPIVKAVDRKYDVIVEFK